MDHPSTAANRAGKANPLQQIVDAMPECRGAARRVAEIILASPEKVAGSSITWLAEAAKTSPATVTRLAEQLGFDGYPALRTAIAMERGRAAQSSWESDIGSAIQPNDRPDQVLRVLAGTAANALRNALAEIDLEAITKVAEAIAVAHRVHIYGEWGDAIPAQELAIRLLRIGIPVWFHDGNQASRIGAGLLAPGDVALAVSRAGQEPTGIDFLRLSGERGALTVAITGEPQSKIAKTAAIALYTGTRNGENWTEFFAGRASDTLTAGLLFVLVAQRVPKHMTAFNPYGPGHPVGGEPSASGSTDGEERR
ncbi:MurR/RpiR family transcriptional regulator (plasmid) [Rhizobium sullae]|uniref:MurR/RpiR family transcriptional regulator n=1 Tax=Rhizobium sullae TaxID=50338 RepID=A0A2N0D7G6_RHISU|nr:MurR/RpiR family transcriptional regulator [Rhizobium sullae]PKA42016.1 MurR/RpiR family transcriptional regulator [Rhizobium sullae]UWU18485.1 MurR/RpiR family transcriptional regulator [Rhizobium sullae]